TRSSSPGTSTARPWPPSSSSRRRSSRSAPRSSWSKRSPASSSERRATQASTSRSRRSPRPALPVDRRPLPPKLLRLLAHPSFQGLPLVELLLFRVLADLLGDLHRAEVGTAHGAEVGELGALLGEGLVVIGARRVGVEREVELVLPAELEAGL